MTDKDIKTFQEIDINFDSLELEEYEAKLKEIEKRMDYIVENDLDDTKEGFEEYQSLGEPYAQLIDKIKELKNDKD